MTRGQGKKDMVVTVPTAMLEGGGEEPDDPLYAHFQKIASLLIDFHDKVTLSVKGLSDDEVLRLAGICDKESEPGEDPFGRGTSKNFAMPEWAKIAQQLRAEVGWRTAHREAMAYIERTGASYYCLYCRGECTPEHLAELDGS